VQRRLDRVRCSPFLAGLSIALFACSSGNTSLAQLPDISLNVEVDTDDPINIVEVELWPDFWEFVETEGECPVLGSSLRGELNGVELEVKDRGGVRNQGDLSGDPSSCVGVLMEVDLGRERPDRLEIVIEDDSGSIEAVFGDFYAPRRMSVVDPADGVVRPGEDVEVAWTPAADAFRETFTASVLDAATMERLFYAEVVGTAADMTLDFPPASDDVWLRERDVLVTVDLSGYAPGAERCVGAAECRAFPYYPEDSEVHPPPLPLTLRP
jgi:hypothetical protein